MSVAKTVAAVALAGAMVAAAVGLPAVSRNAYAEELSAQNNTDGVAGLCTPTTGTMGDSSGDINATDTGVATYVGGDMFVGKRSGDVAMRNNNGESGGGPLGSYAAEIEGATVVNGDLYTKLKKGFFTAGVVAFGSQFVPGQGTQVLTVGGNTKTTAKPSDNSHAFAWKDPEAPALSNMSRSVVGVSDNNKLKANGTATTEYTASIAGNKYNLYGKDRDDTYASVVAYSGKDGRVSWDASNPLSNIKGLDNGADETGTGKTDFTEYGTYLQDLSKQMAAYKGTDAMTVNTTGTLGNIDPNGDANVYTRYKYNWNNAKGEASYKFEFTSLNEKLITFHGDGKSALQVFTISADDLKTDNGQTGISYKFENIPENTSIVINVTGGNVEFHNGWRFLWQAPNETAPTDLSNGYWNPGAKGTTAQMKAYKDYAERASKILWNFADATNVTILGGQASGRMDAQNVSGTGKWQYGNLETDDDPAAAMMGSILVPNGNFESHVSTNGRVWVGGDFSMYNPTAAHQKDNAGNKFVNNAGQHSASVIDMDQERHNLPWSGNYTSQCASLEWSKVDAAADDTKLLAGSSWAIYSSEGDARSGTNPLKLVTDNEPAVDLNGTAGIIKVGGLNTNATYYVKEIGAPQDYAPSDVIYMVTSGDQGTTVTISEDVNGNDVTDGKIPNEKRGTSLTWKKTKEDGTTALAGTSWKLTKKVEAGTGAQDQSWTVTDNTVAANAVNIYRKSDETQANPLSELTMNMNETVQLTTKVTPTGALQKVVWSSPTTNYQNILRIQSNSDGTSIAYAVGVGTVEAQACTVSEANGNGNDVRQTCATLNVTVAANVVNVPDFDVKANGSSITNGSTLTMKPKATIQLNVTAKDAEGNAVAPTYESYATNVATASETGLITAVADGKATIVVRAGNQTRVFAVKVSSVDPVQYTYVYFPASGEGAWGSDTVWVHYGTGEQLAGFRTYGRCRL
ncbi:choice-of-anchor A family protein [Bifidobacterium myosotis]|nr:choice-of-anchor A family protein [Bifidobacterium myosotis]